MPTSRWFFTVCRLAAAVALAVLFAAAPAGAQSQLVTLPTKGPVQVRGESVTYEEATESYLAEGQVEVVSGTYRLMADRVRLFRQTMLAEAEGGVYLVAPDHEFTGSRLLLDLQNEKGKLYDGVLFFKTNNYWIRGTEIEKTGPSSYTMNRGSFTTCDGEKPPWAITGSRVVVTVEGYGSARNAALRVKDFPVLWTPYTRFPAKTKRTSGLLFPHIGQSDRDGMLFSIPYYQVLGEDMDATFTVTYMSKRGPDFGGEFRYHLDPNSKGMWMINYMPDDGQGQVLKDAGKNAEAYSARYWIRGMADQQLFNDTFTLKANIDYVSDQDYLREFDFGYNGFNSSHERFLLWFGRGLDPNRSLTRYSQVTLNRNWDAATFNAQMRYTDVLDTDNKNTLQYYPYISLAAIRQAMGNTGLYFQMASSYTYYYREEGSTGHVSDIAPTISLPLNFNNKLELEPSLTYSQRFYSVKRGDSDDAGLNQTGTNYLWNFGTSASTYLYRVFSFGTSADPFKIKHAIRPYVNWNYQPEIQENDVIDIASRTQAKTNYFSYGLQNYFTSKTMSYDPKTKKMMPKYQEFLRLNLAHSFDLAKYQETPAADQPEPKPWGEITGSFEFKPTERFLAQADTGYNIYSNRWSSFNFYTKAETEKGHKLEFDYRYTHGSLRQANLRGTYVFNKRWSTSLIFRHDLITGADYEKAFEIAFTEQCWGLRLLVLEDVNQRGIFLAISLGGFGEIFSWGHSKPVQGG